MDYETATKQISDLIGGRSAQQEQELANLRNQYGYQNTYDTLQGVRRNVSDTTKALAALPEQMQQRTAGSLVTSGQLSRLTNAESDPISKNLATLNTTETAQQQALTDINNAIAGQQAQSQQTYSEKLAALQNVQSQLAAAKLAAQQAAEERANLAYQQQLSDQATAKAEAAATAKTTAETAAANTALNKKINNMDEGQLYDFINANRDNWSQATEDAAWSAWKTKKYGSWATNLTQDQIAAKYAQPVTYNVDLNRLSNGMSKNSPLLTYAEQLKKAGYK